MTKAQPSLLELAALIDECVKDAIRLEAHPGYDEVFSAPDRRIICLAKGLGAIAAALRATEHPHD